MSYIYTGERCRPQSKFMDLSPPDVYGLHCLPVPISDGSGLDPCCSPMDGMLHLLYMHCYPSLGIPSLHSASIFVFNHPLLHWPSCLSNVRELAVHTVHTLATPHPPHAQRLDHA